MRFTVGSITGCTFKDNIELIQLKVTDFLSDKIDWDAFSTWGFIYWAGARKSLFLGIQIAETHTAVANRISLSW